MKARHWFLVGALTALVAVQANAQEGKNAGGYLVFYTNDAVVFTTDQASYNGLSGVTCANSPCPPGIDCSNNKAIVQAAATSGLPVNSTAVWWLLAGWPEETCPRLTAVQFGINYDKDHMSIIAFGTDADFELQSNAHNGDAWPLPNSGTAVKWNSPKTAHLVEVYWFAGAAYYDNENFDIAIHPAGNAWPVFGDDQIPAVLDEIGLGYNPNDPLAKFLPTLGLAGAAGNNGDVTPTKSETWGGIKSRYGRD